MTRPSALSADAVVRAVCRRSRACCLPTHRAANRARGSLPRCTVAIIDGVDPSALRPSPPRDARLGVRCPPRRTVTVLSGGQVKLPAAVGDRVVVPAAPTHPVVGSGGPTRMAGDDVVRVTQRHRRGAARGTGRHDHGPAAALRWPGVLRSAPIPQAGQGRQLTDRHLQPARPTLGMILETAVEVAVRAAGPSRPGRRPSTRPATPNRPGRPGAGGRR